MRNIRRILVSVITILVLIGTNLVFAETKVYFSPYDDGEAQWISVIDSAKEYIAISCFGITNKNITAKLIEKQKAGVKVTLCDDRRSSMGRSDTCNVLRNAGVDVVIKKTWVLEHNKMIVVDGKNAIIGSWNLSGNAQAQDNSLAVFTDEPVIAEQVKAAIDRIYKRDK